MKIQMHTLLKNTQILAVILWLCLSVVGKAQSGSGEIGDLIAKEEWEHPYLLFDNESKVDLLDKIEASQKLSEILEKQLLLAERNLKLPIETNITLPLERSRIYDKGEVFQLFRSYGEAAVNLAFMYQMTGNIAYANKAFEYAEMLCKLDSWVYSFHKFTNVYSRVWPWNVEDNQVVFSYDIESARVTTKLSLVYDWLYPMLSKAQRGRIRGAILENAIMRVRGNYEYHWWATAYRCNWSGICHSGIGIAALTLLKDDPHLIDVVGTSYSGVEGMINEIGEDGGWQEGRGYWAFGLSHSSWFMEAVRRMTDEKYNLFVHSKLMNNPADFALYTIGASFGDGRGRPVGSSWFINKMITETDNSTAAFYRNNYVRTQESIFDLIWSEPDTEAIEPKVKSKHFRSIDWAVMQNDFYSNNSFSIICKAGQNDDPHHGHLDCGHFILNYKQREFIKDYGFPSYDDYYFSSKRWSYTLASSFGHNVVHVNDEAQIPAKLKNQEWKENVGGTITLFSTSDTLDYLSMNLTNAYPGKELKSWQRQIIYQKPTIALILDNVSTDKGAEITSRIHPGGDVEIKNGYFTIENQNEKMLVIPFSNQQHQIIRGRDASVSVKEENNFKWIPYVELIAEAQSENTLMGWLILPFEEGVEPDGIVSSVRVKNIDEKDVDISFEVNNKPYTYSFKKKDKQGEPVLD